MADAGALEPAADRVPGASSSVPPRPVIKVGEWGDWPYLLVYSGHLSIGWQNHPEKKGGPRYLVGRTGTVTGGTKVVERFPFTEEGWGKAWRFLVRRDKALAEKIREELTVRAAAERARAELAQLDAAALVNLKAVIFLGGYAADMVLAAGQPYDLRFLSDRLVIRQHDQSEALAEVLYGEVEALDVGGPGSVNRLSRGQQVGMTLAFGLVGAALAYTDTKIQTIVRIQAADSEFHFLCTTTTPDALRVQLSRPLGAIRDARAAKPPASARLAGEAAAAVGELSRLASLLEAGLLTREEFDRLKAQLLADS
jgi:Short C-terminal domain